MPSAVDHEPPEQRTVHRTWVPLFLIALLLGAAFTAVFLGLQRDPGPQFLPLAVVGQPLSEAARSGLGDAVLVTTVATPEEGEALVRGGAVVGSGGPGQLRLDYAGSAGASESAAARALVGGLGRATGSTVVDQDVVPLARFDARGLSAFYVVFGVTLSSFILAQLLSSGAAVFARLHHKFAVVAAFTVAIGLVAATVAGPVYETLPASFLVLVLSLVLLSAAVAFATTAMAAWLGPPGISVAVLVFTILGNATSGASIGFDLLPSWARALSVVLPNGAATRIIQDHGYFGGSGSWSAVLVLLGWFVVSLLLVVLRQRRVEHRGRHLPAPTGASALAAAP